MTELSEAVELHFIENLSDDRESGDREISSVQTSESGGVRIMSSKYRYIYIVYIQATIGLRQWGIIRQIYKFLDYGTDCLSERCTYS